MARLCCGSEKESKRDEEEADEMGDSMSEMNFGRGRGWGGDSEMESGREGSSAAISSWVESSMTVLLLVVLLL